MVSTRVPTSCCALVLVAPARAHAPDALEPLRRGDDAQRPSIRGTVDDRDVVTDAHVGILRRRGGVGDGVDSGLAHGQRREGRLIMLTV